MSEWISVKDRLPPENHKVLAIWSYGTNSAEMITVLWNRERGWYNDDLCITNGYFITYWTEVPDHPKEFWK